MEDLCCTREVESKVPVGVTAPGDKLRQSPGELCLDKLGLPVSQVVEFLVGGAVLVAGGRIP